MERFAQSVEFVLDHEGGYVNDPLDPGGETRYGISKRQYPDVDIRNLTRDQAIDIYHHDYWDKCECDRLPAGLDLLVFDTAVNRGTRRAIQRLQVALRVTVDGLLGPQTFRAAERAHTGSLVDEFTSQRLVAYARLRQFSRYGLGWTRRIVAAHREALA